MLLYLENEFLYTGRRLDPETGLYQYRHRYYHAQLGRFLTRDPILKLAALRPYLYSGSPLTFLDPSGKNGCEGPQTMLKPTYEIPDAHLKVHEDYTKEVRAKFPASDYEFTYYYGHTGSGDYEGVAGFSGGILGATLSTARANGCCCDFSQVELGFMAFYGVIINQRGSRDIIFKNGDGEWVEIPGPSNTREHEQWHTDGAEISYGEIYDTHVVRLPPRPGYNAGARSAMNQARRCMRLATKKCDYPVSDERCKTWARFCTLRYFASAKALSWIFAHGFWHIAITEDDQHFLWNVLDYPDYHRSLPKYKCPDR